MKIRSIILLIITFLFLISHSKALSSEMQEKIAFQYCNLSLNDPNFGNWDVSSKTGVFYGFVNLKGNLQNSFGQYNYSIYSNDYRLYFNNFKKVGVSSIPIINIYDGSEAIIYTKCLLKNLDDYTADINGYYVPAGTNLLMSSDFNITKGIVPNELVTNFERGIGELSGSNFSYFQIGNNNPFSFYINNQGKNYYDYNNLYYSTGLTNIPPGGEVEIVSALNFTGAYVSGLFFKRAGVGSSLETHYYSANTNDAGLAPVFVFYINSTIKNFDEQKDLVTQKFYPEPSGQGRYILSRAGVNRSIYGVGNQLNFLLMPGDVFYYNLSFKNIYGFDLNNSYYLKYMNGRIMTGMGVGEGINYGNIYVRKKSDVFSGGIGKEIIFDLGNFSVNQKKEFLVPFNYLNSTEYDISIGVTNNNLVLNGKGGNYYNIYGPIATDGFPYIGIGGNTGGKVELYDSGGGNLIPRFDFKSELIGFLGQVNTSILDYSNYYLLFKIFDSIDNRYVYSSTSPINTKTVFPRSNSSVNKYVKDFNYYAYINDKSIFSPGHSYELEVYIVYNGSNYNEKNWKDKIISVYPEEIKLIPGSTLYSSANNFTIGPMNYPNTPSGETKNISLFNPYLTSPYGIDINLSIDHIVWNNSIDSKIKDHLYICVSSSLIVNYSSCDLIYRYGYNNKSSYMYENIFPFQEKKLFLHIYCNDTGNSFEKLCGNGPGYYGEIYLKSEYTYTNKVNDFITFKIFSKDGFCGDGTKSGIEMCDYGSIESGSNMCGLNAICNSSCSCETPIRPGFESPFWLYENGEKITGNVDMSRKIKMFISTYGFNNDTNKNLFKFNIFNDLELTNIFEGENINYVQNSLINKSNITSKLIYVSELKGIEPNSVYYFFTNISYNSISYKSANSNNINIICKPINSILDCSSLKTSSECELACPLSYNVTEGSIFSCSGTGYTNFNINSGKCSWTGSSCVGNQTVIATQTSGNIGEVGHYIYSTSSEGACLEKFKKFELIGIFVPNSEINGITCDNKTENVMVPCREVAQLPFFDLFNFIIGIISLAFIYFMLYIKRNF